jgi:hypothetical protein
MVRVIAPRLSKELTIDKYKESLDVERAKNTQYRVLMEHAGKCGINLLRVVWSPVGWSL